MRCSRINYSLLSQFTGERGVSTIKRMVMKLKSSLPKQLAFLVRVNVYLLIIFIAYSLLSVWSHTASPVVGAATMIILFPACLILLSLNLVAYFTNSGILFILLTIIYVFFTVSSVSSSASGHIESNYLVGYVFILYEMAYSLLFAYSSYYSFRFKSKSRNQREVKNANNRVNLSGYK